MSILDYKWTDTPDDQDAIKKTFCLSKKAFKIGTLLAVGDVIFCKEKRTVWQKAYRFGYYIVPLVGMATAYTAAVQLSTKMAPSWNHNYHYLLGGIAAAGIAGHWKKSGPVFLNTALIFGFTSVAYYSFRVAAEETKGTPYGEFYQTSFPKDFKYLCEERYRSGNWFFADYDYRIFKNKTRSNAVDYIEPY